MGLVISIFNQEPDQPWIVRHDQSRISENGVGKATCTKIIVASPAFQVESVLLKNKKLQTQESAMVAA